MRKIIKKLYTMPLCELGALFGFAGSLVLYFLFDDVSRASFWMLYTIALILRSFMFRR